jgi:hypothetical protein
VSNCVMSRATAATGLSLPTSTSNFLIFYT